MKLQSYAIVAAFIFAVVGLAFGYHQLVVSNSLKEIAELKTDVATLTVNNKTLKDNVDKATVANKSFEDQLTKYEAQTSEMIHALMEINQRDEEIKAWFDSANEAIASVKAKQELVEQFKADPAGSIVQANKEMSCIFDHFGQQGTCRGEVFVPFNVK